MKITIITYLEQRGRQAEHDVVVDQVAKALKANGSMRRRSWASTATSAS